MMKPSTLILSPVTCGVALGINALRMVELFRLNCSELIIHLDLPFCKEFSLGEALDQITDSFESFLRVGNHMLSKSSHFERIICEARGKTCFMAS
jgi:hypothetical protein